MEAYLGGGGWLSPQALIHAAYDNNNNNNKMSIPLTF